MSAALPHGAAARRSPTERPPRDRVTRRILAAGSPGEVRVAAVDGERVEDFALWRPGAPDGVGDLHRGRISAVLPALAGAFVTLEDAEGFLPDSEGGAGCQVGDTVGVRVTRAAQGSKGPRLSGRLDAAAMAQIGTGPPRRLARGTAPILRLAAAWPEAPVLTDDLAITAAFRPALGPRLHHVARVLDETLESELAALELPEVALPGGMRASFHPTPALVAIDMDTAAASAERRPKPAAQMAANRAALPELARQIRLRNLGGAILIDFAGLATKRRGLLGPELAAALAADPLRPRLLGFTRLGLAEIVRPRVHPPLHELLAGPHAAGLRALRQLAAEQQAGPDGGLGIDAAPPVIAALQADAAARDALVQRLGRPLILRADPTLLPLGWRIVERAHG